MECSSRGAAKGAGSLCTEKSYADFVLRVRTRAQDSGSRSAVLIRALPSTASRGAVGLTVPLRRAEWGTLRDPSGRVLARAEDSTLGRVEKTEDWIEHAIYANGGQVRVFVNGLLLSDHAESGSTFSRIGAICVRGRRPAVRQRALP